MIFFSYTAVLEIAFRFRIDRIVKPDPTESKPTSAAFVPPGDLPDDLRSVPINLRVDVFKCPGTKCICLRNGAFSGPCWYRSVIPIFGRTVRVLVALANLSSRYLFRLETIRSNSRNNGPSIPGETVVSVLSLLCENGKRGRIFAENRVLVSLLIFRRCGYGVLDSF